jgi:Transposase DDE domain group 1
MTEPAVLVRLRADRAGSRSDPRNPEDAWVPALGQDGTERENGQVGEITHLLDLCSWPEGSRVIVRRERPHPGAQLSFTDHDGYRFQAILTDQTDPAIAVIECRHRQRARVEDRIRDDKDTGLSKFPFKAFALNEVLLEIVLLAHDLIVVWTQALCLDGELAGPNRNGCASGRCTSAPGSRSPAAKRSSNLQHTWPWAEALTAAFEKLKKLAAATG